MASSDVLAVVMDALHRASDDTFSFPAGRLPTLTADLKARALLPSAAEDLNRLTRFAAFLGTTKNSPEAAVSLLGALHQMVDAMGPAGAPLREAAAEQVEAARRLLGAPASGGPLVGQGVMATARASGELGAQLARTFQSQSMRGTRPPPPTAAPGAAPAPGPAAARGPKAAKPLKHR